MERPHTKPCPFCGSINLRILELDKNSWAIECNDCHATGPIISSIENAIASWNNGNKVLLNVRL